MGHSALSPMTRLWHRADRDHLSDCHALHPGLRRRGGRRLRAPPRLRGLGRHGQGGHARGLRGEDLGRGTRGRLGPLRPYPPSPPAARPYPALDRMGAGALLCARRRGGERDGPFGPVPDDPPGPRGARLPATKKWQRAAGKKKSGGESHRHFLAATFRPAGTRERSQIGCERSISCQEVAGSLTATFWLPLFHSLPLSARLAATKKRRGDGPTRPRPQ